VLGDIGDRFCQSLFELGLQVLTFRTLTCSESGVTIVFASHQHLGEGSCIIGTTSEQAYDPSPDLYDYAQTKAATMNYVKSPAKQLGPKGIRVIQP
jgi:NAD(P)-dependent dehydrogenase (short-subunit alcohol dehydrogenase family)